MSFGPLPAFSPCQSIGSCQPQGMHLPPWCLPQESDLPTCPCLPFFSSAHNLEPTAGPELPGQMGVQGRPLLASRMSPPEAAFPTSCSSLLPSCCRQAQGQPMGRAADPIPLGRVGNSPSERQTKPLRLSFGGVCCLPKSNKSDFLVLQQQGSFSGRRHLETAMCFRCLAHP